MQTELARYSHIAAWQIDNELGFNLCFCPECDESFRGRMRASYGATSVLNEAVGGAFWSNDIQSWDQLVVPRAGSGNSNSPEMLLARSQFYSDTILGFMDEQVAVLKEAGCTAPISTNFMGNFDQVDYWKGVKNLDFVGWDNYPFVFTLSASSFAHNLMRSLGKGRPYWTFENGVELYPKANIIHGISALAHGEEVHTLFRWDTCSFGHEMDLLGLVDWEGRPRQKLAEIRELANIVDDFRKIDLPPLVPRTAIVFSYQNYWSNDKYYGSYWNEVNDYYQALFDLGIPTDCVHPGADLSGYDLLLAPGLSIASDDELANIRAWVARGGVLVAGRKSFSRLPSGSYRATAHPALSDVFGMRVADGFSDEDFNDIAASIYKPPFPRLSWPIAGAEKLPSTTTRGWYEMLDLNGATPLYRYADGPYCDAIAASVSKFGNGRAYYLGVMPEREALREILRNAAQVAHIDCMVNVPQGAQVVRRGNVCIVTNHTAQPLTVPLPWPATAVLGCAPTDGSVVLPPFAYSVVKQVV